jgi:hypothetical protein
MLKNYSLLFFIRDQDCLRFNVPMKESNKLYTLLDDDATPSDTIRFFTFKTIDKRIVAINLFDVQAVKFQRDSPLDMMNARPEDEYGKDTAHILLRGHTEPLEEYPDTPEQLCDLFDSLTPIPIEVDPYCRYVVEGEPLVLSVKDVVWVAAPLSLFKEGERNIMKVLEKEYEKRDPVVKPSS